MYGVACVFHSRLSLSDRLSNSFLSLSLSLVSQGTWLLFLYPVQQWWWSRMKQDPRLCGRRILMLHWRKKLVM